MYGKLFESIYDGTLVEDWQALITFQQMIILCDSDGTLDMTPSAISRRTGIPINHIKHGIKILEKEDPESRTPDENGKRIKRIDEHRDWGWVIINHKKYRDLKTSSDRREYMRRYMRKKREKELTKTNKSLRVNNVTHTDADADADTDTQNQKKEKKTLVVPDWINTDIWKAFIKHRQKLKAPMTDHAKELMINKLKKLTGNPNDMLNQSIEMGWKGVFEVKQENNNGTYQQTNKSSLGERATAAREKYEQQIDRQNDVELMGEIQPHLRS